MAKSTKAPPVSVSIPALRAPVTAIVSAFKKAESANAAIKTAVVHAADIVKAEQVETFVSMVRGSLQSVLTPASIKVECSRIKRVLSALIAGDIKASDAVSLRGLYDLTKKSHGPQGADTAPHADNADDEIATAAPAAPMISRTEAIRVLFGHFDGELEAAVNYAASMENAFIRWAKASAAAAQNAEIEKAAASLEKALAKPATVRKTPAKRQRKAA